MAQLELRKESATKALQLLERKIIKLNLINPQTDEEGYEDARIVVIHSFEIAIESFWKYIRTFLWDIRKMDVVHVPSPRSIIRAAQEDGTLNKEEARQALAALEDRNRTSHTYTEKVAEAVLRRTIIHAKIMRIIIDRLGENT